MQGRGRVCGGGGEVGVGREKAGVMAHGSAVDVSTDHTISYERASLLWDQACTDNLELPSKCLYVYILNYHYAMIAIILRLKN